MANFKFVPNETLPINLRSGETRLGEKIYTYKEASKADFLILGISEDIGPQFNLGNPGAKFGFDSFLSTFCNTQHNLFIERAKIAVIGEIIQLNDFNNLNCVPELDELVYKTLNEHLLPHQKLIVIGGGHNNAYPIIKHFAKKGSTHSINIDPHADCRKTDQRHSGNPFSFALEEKLLKSYSVFGLHENYNNQFLLDFLKSNNCKHSFFEDYLDNSQSFLDDIENQCSAIPNGDKLLLDIDLDSIANMPCSAFTPSGFNIEEIRRIIRLTGKTRSISSLHLPEGAPLTEEENKWYGKTLSYLVLDFIKQQII
jgi:formiminoglutamase